MTTARRIQFDESATHGVPMRMTRSPAMRMLVALCGFSGKDMGGVFRVDCNTDDRDRAILVVVNARFTGKHSVFLRLYDPFTTITVSTSADTLDKALSAINDALRME